jgi:hypothetical protein
LFAGSGRLRIGFSELNPAAGREPNEHEIKAAVQGCWENPYCTFNGVPGTSLVCIQGDWSNVVDGKIKGELASLALGRSSESPYNPLYARGINVPRPWGITTLFSEYTGNHSPVEIDWTSEKRLPLRFTDQPEPEGVALGVRGDTPEPAPVVVAQASRPRTEMPVFATFWDFALAINRSESAAIKIARDSADAQIPIDIVELRKLLNTFWFRSVFQRLSAAWQSRMLDVLVEHVSIPNHQIRTGRRTVHLGELSHEQRRQLLNGTVLPDVVRADLQLLVMVGALWGDTALERFELTAVPDAIETSGLGSLLQPFRHS